MTKKVDSLILTPGWNFDFFIAFKDRCKLMKHFGELEEQHGEKFLDPNKNRELSFRLPGDDENVFDVVPMYKPIYRREQKRDGSWHTLREGKKHTGNMLNLKQGFHSIKKIIEFDPKFFPELFKLFHELEDYRYNKVEFNFDSTHEVVNRVAQAIKKNHYNSFGKGVRAMSPGITQKLYTYYSDEVTVEKGVVGRFKKSIAIGRQAGNKIVLDERDWKDLDSIYTGDFKKSDTTIHFYKKGNQMFDKKSRFSNFDSRVEIRYYPKYNQETLTNFSEAEYLRQVLSGKEKISILFSPTVLEECFKDYFSPEAVTLRTILFLFGLLHNFTLSKTVREKAELSPWYVDNLITPHWCLLEHFGLIPHEQVAEDVSERSLIKREAAVKKREAKKAIKEKTNTQINVRETQGTERETPVRVRETRDKSWNIFDKVREGLINVRETRVAEREAPKAETKDEIETKNPEIVLRL